MSLIDWTKQKDWMNERSLEQSKVVCDEVGVSLNWRYEYFIHWGQIKTKEHLVQWCHHLLEKGWFTPSRCRMFLEVVCEYRGWELYQ